MGIKNFLMKKMMKAKGVPEDQIEMILGIMEKDPELFKKIAKETEAHVKGGMNEQMAGMKVMMKYKSELQKLMQK